MKAIVSVIGKDKKGIIARVSGELFDMGQVFPRFRRQNDGIFIKAFLFKEVFSDFQSLFFINERHAFHGRHDFNPIAN